jgi:hypothetical protein
MKVPGVPPVASAYSLDSWGLGYYAYRTPLKGPFRIPIQVASRFLS